MVHSDQDKTRLKKDQPLRGEGELIDTATRERRWLHHFPFTKTLGHFSIGLYLPNQTGVNLNTTRGENGYFIANRPRSWGS
jgi:hypothetical protein